MTRRLAILAAAVAVALASGPAWASCVPGSYTNVSGHRVHRPICTTRHLDHEMAVCRDGSHSMSEHHRGTCSHHGGVERWG